MGVPRILLLTGNSRLIGAVTAACAGTGWDIEVQGDPLFQEAEAGRRFVCTLLDVEVLPDVAHLAIATCIRRHPVILLADAVPQLLHEWVVGEIAPRNIALRAVDAVRRAIARP